MDIEKITPEGKTTLKQLGEAQLIVGEVYKDVKGCQTEAVTLSIMIAQIMANNRLATAVEGVEISCRPVG